MTEAVFDAWMMGCLKVSLFGVVLGVLGCLGGLAAICLTVFNGGLTNG